MLYLYIRLIYCEQYSILFGRRMQMTYLLMHKKIPVVELTLDDTSCVIIDITKVMNPEHLPVGVTVKNSAVDKVALTRWWRRRAIPASRDGLSQALDELDIALPEILLEKCYGLSLSDQYWICPKDSELRWEDINFFDNPFSEDVGNILLGHASSSDSISLVSPDNSSDGWLKKKWAIIDGKRCLLKYGSGAFQQEPYNEVIAASIMKRLQIPHVGYSVTIQKDKPYSVCEDFITADTELISAQHLMESRKRPNHLTKYQHFVECCESVGIVEITDFLDRLLTVDFLIANEDRHFNNFGVIRNAETLEYVGMAPIYDNGTSLWYNTAAHLIKPMAPGISSKPFKDTHGEQITLVHSFDWLDVSALDGIADEYNELLTTSSFVDGVRREILCDALAARIHMLKEII